MDGLEGTCWIDRCLVRFDVTPSLVGFSEVELARTLDYPVRFGS